MSPGSRVLPHRRLHRGIKSGGYGYKSPKATVVVAPAVGMWVTAQRLSKLCVSRASYPRPPWRAVDATFAFAVGVWLLNRRMLPHLFGRRRRAAAAAGTAA